MVENEVVEIAPEKIGGEHLYELLTGKEVSWQAIIYDLINSGQLDPWNIDLALLSNRYLEKVKLLEEANFLISSKVLIAVSLLLRIKAEILLNDYITNIDDILFGRKQESGKPVERIEIDVNELPTLYPRTPLPRMRKVSLQELMLALSKAIGTESRRIKREIDEKQLMREAEIVMPKTRINIKDRIRKIYSRILTMFKAKQARISYTELVGNNRDEKISAFLPVLHLDNQKRIWLEQEKHFDEIWVWLYNHYKSQQKISPEMQAMQEEKPEEAEAGIDNPLAGFDQFEDLNLENIGD